MTLLNNCHLTYDAPVTERGCIFLVVRQLLAFARTVAFKPKILILDEATANIDSETEELIQSFAEKNATGRTTIAMLPSLPFRMLTYLWR